MVVRLNCTKGLSKAELTFIGELSKNEYVSTYVLHIYAYVFLTINAYLTI